MLIHVEDAISLDEGIGGRAGERTIFFFFFLRAAPMSYGGSQARGRIGATAASLGHSHSNARSKLCLRPTPQLMAMPDP